MICQASRACLASITLLVMLAYAGCHTATPTMSVEEAKQVTATFGGVPLVPPPRTIRDVLTLLEPDSQTGEWLGRVKRGAASSPAPAATGEALGRYFYDRGNAARRLGRFAQAKQDYARAAELIRPGQANHGADPWPVDFGVVILKELAETETASGNLWKAIERYDAAVTAARRIQAGFLPELLGNLTRVHAETGNLKAAQAALDELRLVVREFLPGQIPWPEVRAGFAASLAIGEAAMLEARGRLDEAERRWRQAIEEMLPGAERDTGIGAVHWLRERLDTTRARLAQCLLRQGRLIEAEIEARAALRAKLDRRHTFPFDAPMVATLLGRVLRAQGRYAESERLVRAITALYEGGGAIAAGSPSVIAPRLELAALLAAQGRWGEARQEYATVRVALADDRLWAILVERDVAYLLVQVRTGHAADALVLTRRALALSASVRGESDTTTAELRAILAMAHAALGDDATARREFATASAVLSHRGFEVDDESTTTRERDRRVRTMLGDYVATLARERVRAPGLADPLDEAFAIAQTVAGRGVERALDASSARTVARTPALAELVRREQDTQKQLAALLGRLATSVDGPEASSIAGHLRVRIDQLQRARHVLARRISQEFPAYAQLVSPAPSTREQARAALRPGEALIATLVADDPTYVWALPHRGALAFAALPLGEKELAERVGRLRRALDSRARTLGEIPPFDVVTAYELYRDPLEPVRMGWERADRLLIVAHGPLGQLPFGVLVTARAGDLPDRPPLFSAYRDVPWLIRRHSLTTLPSVSALTTLRRPGAILPERRPFVGFGDPYFAAEHAREATNDRVALGGVGDVATRTYTVAMRDVMVSPAVEVSTSRFAMLPRLADTAEEILAIARAMNADVTRDVFLGVAANERTVKTLDLTKYRVVAFATHGLVPGDLDGLTQPALALTAPDVARIDGDGLLTMDEILALRLDADWVVLSACNTANGAGSGAEAISGLGRAFFYAGARALLVTHWPVETTSARALTTQLFKRQAMDPSIPRARALHLTMNALIDEGELIDPSIGKVVFSYAHPIFWAPFALVGDGGQ